MEPGEEKGLGIDWGSLSIGLGDNLPHWTCSRATYHVAFRLADSVPESARLQWIAERRNILDAIALQGREPSEHELYRLQQLYSGKTEAFLRSGHGRCLLAHAPIGEMVAGALAFFHGTRYSLHAYCVMPNHVHVVVTPFPGFGLERIVRDWKSYTAKQANRMCGRKGVFWQHESYDHIIRSEKEFAMLMDYVWDNPGDMVSGFVRKRYG